ncbi:hypothetical protein KKG29_05805 [Patescibacteria group bacterium]|nr:hypothetical protein [Desulfobacteraceae bacterium]MBU4000652.1 hypothetical protein [Patescibacteria group bacterium]
MFELILNRFAAIGREGTEILSSEVLAAWPQGEVAELKRLNLLKKAAPAKIIECTGCEEACLMPVNVYPTQDGRAARIFIACDKREDTGRILIEPSDLEQWQIDVGRFVSLLASALGADYVPDEIVLNQAYYLGTLTINRKRRSAIFVANNEALNSALEDGLFEQYSHPFFLVAADLHSFQEIKQGAILSLRQLLIFPDNDSLSFDCEMLEHLISKDDARNAAAKATGKNISDENIFRKEGQMWTLCYGGVTKYLKHSKGLLYISYLLGSPFQEYHVAELVKVAETPGKEVLSFSSGEVSTKETVANYRKRLTDIHNELAEADETEDLLLKKELLKEKQGLEKQLLQAVGMGGKLKKNPDETKRQANAVSEAITRSLKTIDKNHHSLWQHLLNAINRGEYLSYAPETDISWITI